MTINIVSIIFFVIAGVSFFVAVYSFIRFNIPQVIGELSGRTARKSVAQMRDNNSQTGNKSHRPTKVAQERGTLTDKIDPKSTNTNKEKKSDEIKSFDEGTVVLNSSNNSSTNDATELLSNETELFNNETELLNDNSTEPLDEGTVLLTEKDKVNQEPKNINGFTMIQDIVLVYTNEFI